MTLNSAQQQQTARELETNLHATGLSADELRERTGLDSARFAAAMSVDGSDPVDVWRVRDAIADVLEHQRASGAQPAGVPFTILTDDKRASARAWFGYER